MHGRLLFAVSFALFKHVLAGPHPHALSPDTVVDLGYASYRGIQSSIYPLCVAFLGIPYAEPPVGPLRFRGTVPLNASRVAAEADGQVVDATQYPGFCIQGSIGGELFKGDAGGAGSEDCLKVNVYAPVNATKDSHLPVLVYIHGGGFVYGNPRNWPFDHWIQQSPNIVVASVYYRLDSFGFLSHPSMPTADLNAGIRDQLAALHWIKRHISAFGGDPGRVTINGQSAGGASVELHLIANEGEELFQAGIAQSVARGPLPGPEQEVPLFEAYATVARCAGGSFDAQIECLRSASVNVLAHAQDTVSAFNTSLLIRDHPTKLIQEGNFRRVPLMVGATSNETFGDSTEFAPPLKSSFPGLTNATVVRYEAAYPVSQPDFGGNTTLRNIVAHGEALLRCARSVMGLAWSMRGNPTFTYRFNQPNPTVGPPDLTMHAAENWWMFLGTNTGTNGSTTFSPMTPAQTAFAQELIAYWISFVRTHDPSALRLARSRAWTQFSVSSPQRMVLEMDAADGESGSALEDEGGDGRARCTFVASIVDEMQD
ncbi:Alpha/Beta hydrolase protein [Vararia minispora EC-137]|uniref:Alpha/Beta hydrolase protein n=1 Tax=Vararia minispora EC-137 TaxID=1314806 RepID=A0ACB8QBE5_9AGAM|nr:Alpha/Beta hydrolase protein [Vararia minispora EC-137]